MHNTYIYIYVRGYKEKTVYWQDPRVIKSIGFFYERGDFFVEIFNFLFFFRQYSDSQLTIPFSAMCGVPVAGGDVPHLLIPRPPGLLLPPQPPPAHIPLLTSCSG